MLRLENIKKNYQAGGTSFPALKGVSIAFRKNEFVSILGPSGCGKTTLLNIIGGLDHYSSGDLIIEGKSTKEYKSRDWDIYRNHRIGFIFQSYNLIPHQTILENVELALTIAGYSKQEKRKKAMKALDKVGLKNAYKKMPNQLSGGQCQRVAIARALVNEPDILLGDEPTGALDSKTSVQVMELIKKISKKKLVIMVTHNPPLAEKYSSRIVSLLDGEVVKDTNPYKLEEEKKEKRKVVSEIKVSSGGTAVKPSKAKMSFWSAFKLSAKNLFSKKKRTIMVIAASSIGIVGVSAVLAVSSGVKDYIWNMENDMLSGNPIRASETSLDITTALGNLSNLVKGQKVSEAWRDGYKYLDIEYLTKALIENAKSGSIISNDITDDYVEYLKEMPRDYMADLGIDYSLSFADNIYTKSKIGIHSSEKSTLGYTEDNTIYSMSGMKNIYTAILKSMNEEAPTMDFTPLANVAANFPNVFYQGLDNNDYIKTQYDVLQGRLPNNESTDEFECVVVLNRRKKLLDLIVTLSGLLSEENFIRAVNAFIKEGNLDVLAKTITAKDILDKEFYYIPNGYTPNGGESQEGAFKINYSTEIVKKPFEYNYRFAIDGNDINTIGKYTTGQSERQIIHMDNHPIKRIKVVGIIAPKDGKNYGSLSSGIYFTSNLSNYVMNDISKHNTYDECDENDSDIYKLFVNPAFWNPEYILNEGEMTNYIFIPDKETPTHQTIQLGLSYPIKFVKYYFDEQTGAIKGDPIDKEFAGTVGGTTLITKGTHTYTVDTKKEVVPGTIITSRQDIRNMAGRKTFYSTSTNGNASYSFKHIPYRMTIYAQDFAKKDQVIKYMDRWNSSETITLKSGRTLTADQRTRVTYTDNLTLIIGMINNLINITTISLTVFASLALVVSTVMIGIITYISVMERIKEIGVIRSLGGRKKDVSHLFNAETFILGGISGVFGIAITYLFELILDICIYNTYKIPMIANLRWYTALIMIALSIVLTAISGLIPARSAAKKDPVTALRTE